MIACVEIRRCVLGDGMRASLAVCQAIAKAMAAALFEARCGGPL